MLSLHLNVYTRYYSASYVLMTTPVSDLLRDLCVEIGAESEGQYHINSDIFPTSQPWLSTGLQTGVRIDD
jgi:hypothetical protein